MILYIKEPLQLFLTFEHQAFSQLSMNSILLRTPFCKNSMIFDMTLCM